MKKKYDTDFNIIFLNSLAHFQHNYWTNENEKESKCFFYILNEIIGLLIFHNENYLIVNGFTQEKINKGEYIIYRQKDPENFLKKFNIRYQSLKQNMTNETRISFDSTKDLEIALKTLENIMIEGKKLLQIDTYSQHKEIIIKINIHKKFKNNYFLFQNKKIKIDDLIVGIERTGSHAQNGNIMTNLDIKEKNIYNHEIFKIIYNFYN